MAVTSLIKKGIFSLFWKIGRHGREFNCHWSSLPSFIHEVGLFINITFSLYLICFFGLNYRLSTF